MGNGKGFPTFAGTFYIMKMKQYLALALFPILLTACGDNDRPPVDPDLPTYETIAPPAVIGYKIVNQYPHDTSAYTQGLQIHNGKFYEGTGDYETSSLRIVDIKSGKVEQKHMMGTDKIFGEGINIFNDKLYQLTWENNLVYVYDLKDINKPVQTLKWPYQGWGITNNGTDLIVSDGTANLYFVDPKDFRVKNKIQVITNAGPQMALNELEYIDGFIYANVYEKEYVYKIDPVSGHVVGVIDFSGLPAQYFKEQIVPDRTNVLNGIAYDSASKKMYITGKRWPKMFEVEMNK